MLGKLVNKFKKQSLQDQASQGSSPTESATTIEEVLGSPRKSPKIGSDPNQEQPMVLRKSARLASHSFSSSSSPQLYSKPEPKSKSSSRNANADSITANIFDSGTESDDDELERLDQMDSIIASGGKDMDGVFVFQADANHSPSVNVIGSSPPTLTSSPPLISEIDTSSWDSMGCESGIVLRESAERDDASRNVDLLDSGNSADSAFDTASTPTQRKDGFPVNFGEERRTMELGSDENSPCGTPSQTVLSGSARGGLPVDFSALRDQNMSLLERDTQKMSPFEQSVECSELQTKSSIAKTSGEDKTGRQQFDHGAFRPVIRQPRPQAKNVSNGFMPTQSGGLLPVEARTNTPSPNNLIGEKRRWGIDSGRTGGNLQSPFSPIATRTRGSMIAQQQQLNSHSGEEVPRAVLTARRTRVRVLYHDNSGQHPPRGQHKPPHLSEIKQQANFSESPPNNLVNKRGRHSAKSESGAGERPCLNFDKMRERMMGFNTIQAAGASARFN